MKKLIASLGLFALPVFTFAQTITGSVTNADDLVTKYNSIINVGVGILISFAVIYIIYAIVKYMIAGGADEQAAAGKMVAFGILGLFLILGLWGLVKILSNTFNVGDAASNAPKILPGAVTTH